MVNDPTPDLFDLCVVLNEASGAPLGTSLLPYAERCKRIVIEWLAHEAEGPNGPEYQIYDVVPDWLRRMVQP